MSTTKKSQGGYHIFSVDNTGSIVGNIEVTMDEFIVHGNLIVDGNTTTGGNAEITDSIIFLNVGEAGNGVTSGNSGIEIDRGQLPNASLFFNEATDTWDITVDGGNYTALITSVVEDLSPQLGANLDLNTFEFQTINDELTLRTTGTGNIILTSDSTGYIILDKYTRLTIQGSDPTAVASNNFIYHKTVAGGGTGLFFQNTESEESPDELVSRRKAMLFGLIF